MLVSVKDIAEKSKQALIIHGASEYQASEVARAIARAEETGNIICGLYYLESYCLQLQSGRVDGQADPVVTTNRPGAIGVDAKFGFAQYAFSKGLSPAIDAARQNGIASLSVAHSHTCTSLGFFTEQIAVKGMIAIGMTNASAIVSGPGGKTPVLGTNPIAMSLSSLTKGETKLAMHADFSTAAVALGKITMAKAAGEKIPLGWAVDENGQPTTDPDAALKGSLVSAADYKGWALGLLVEILAAGLTGSVNSLDVKGLKLPEGKPHDLGQFYILIDPSSHNGAFHERLKRIVDAVQADDGPRIPGHRRKEIDPVDVPDQLWALTLKLSS